MEDLGHTPVLKSNDLQSLTDTLNMRLTEIEFENRFSGLFHEDLPVPQPKNVGSFVYPSIKKRNQKRKAPVPPKAKEAEGIINYQLQTLQELGPILAKSATLPPNMNYRVKVKVKSQSTQKSSQHTTLIGYSSLVSVFKIRQTSSLKIRKKTFRKAIRKKNMSLGDLFSDTDSTKPPCGNPSTFCVGACEPSCSRCIRKEENGECPQASSVLQPLPEKSCISPLEIPFSGLGILSTLREQSSPKQEYDKSIVEDTPFRASMISNHTGLKARFLCKQNSLRFNHTCEQGIHSCLLSSPSDTQKSTSYAQDRTSPIKDSFSSGEGHPFCAHNSPSSGHGSAHYMHGSPSSGHGSAHCMHSSPSSGHGIANCMQKSPSSGNGSAPFMHSSPSSGHGSAPFMHSSPSSGHDSAPFMHSSPSRMDGSPSWVHSSPPMQGSSSPVHSSPSMQGSSSPVHSSPSMQGSSSPVHHSPSHQLRTLSCALGSPSYSLGSPSRALGSPSRALGSPSRAHGSPSQGHSSTPCHAQGNQSYVRSGSSSSSRGSPPVHGSPSQLDNSPPQVMGSPSCVQHGSLHNRGNNTRMCGYPSWLQESLLEQSIPMQNSLEVLNSPSKDWKKTLAINPNNSSFINNKLNELENKMEKPCCTSYYKKKLSCDHIYEEVDESCINLSGLDKSPYPPPVPSNSPCISPEILRHSGYLSDDNQLHSVKKMAPQKPPRNRNKEVVLRNGSLAFEEDHCNRMEGLDNLDIENITETESEKTADNTGEIPSDKDEQEKTNEMKKLKTYYFGETFTPDYSSTRKSLPRQTKKSTSSPVSGSRSPGSPSFRAKKPKNKKSRRKFSIPKTFRFSLKTSLGNIRLSGKRFFTRSTHREPQEKALSAYKSWQNKKSPAIISPHNVLIPRIVIHVETPEAGDGYDPEIQEQLEDLNAQSGENTHKKKSPPTPVPSVLSLLNNYEGCDLSVIESQDDFNTPHSYLDNEEQEECFELEFHGATAMKSSFRSTCLPPDEENDDVICIESANNQSKNCQPGFVRSQPDLSSLRSGDEEEVIFLGASKSSRFQKDLRRTSIKDSRLLKENPIYFHSYDDLQIILNSN